MPIKYRPTGASTRYTDLIIYFFVALALAFLQTGLLSFISIKDITPDLMLILIVWIALKHGQFVGLIAGFVCGLMLDVISLDVIGTNALSKTVAAYLAGFFYKEDKILTGDMRFLGIVALSSIVNNLIYFFFYLKASDLAFLPFFMKYGLGMAIYTIAFATLPMIFAMRKN